MNVNQRENGFISIWGILHFTFFSSNIFHSVAIALLNWNLPSLYFLFHLKDDLINETHSSENVASNCCVQDGSRSFRIFKKLYQIEFLHLHLSFYNKWSRLCHIIINNINKTNCLALNVSDINVSKNLTQKVKSFHAKLHLSKIIQNKIP